MLIRGIRQLVVILGPIILITCTVFVLKFYDTSVGAASFLNGRTTTRDFVSSSSSQHPVHDHDADKFDLNVYGKPVHEVFSVSTHKGKYFDIVMGDYEASNPSIIPHPYQEGVWKVIAQQGRSDVPNTVWFAQLVCDAKFVKNKLICIKSPLILPIAATPSKPGNCIGNLNFLSLNIGPHDARVFYGPNNPYAIYGSQSSYNCFGLWTQDLRFLTDWGVIASSPGDIVNPFRFPTELQRPPPYGVMEKNWFVFWDNNDVLHTHYDIYPKRVFSAMSIDGTPGPDLAGVSAKDDEVCMTKYMPKLAPTLESIHQATNSLKVTLCKRADPACIPNDTNTFIMTIFHHKTFYYYHGVYEPYVMLFQQSAPFAVHGISQKPIWIHGRGKAPRREGLSPQSKWEETEMFYVTSIAWKNFGQKYHGYIDDVLFVAFGIEDQRAAGIDVTAGDILGHLGLCKEEEVITPPAPPPVALSPEENIVNPLAAVVDPSAPLTGGTNVLPPS